MEDIKSALGFGILFWLVSMIGHSALDYLPFIKDNVWLSITHSAVSTVAMFLISIIIFRKFGKNLVDFTLITLFTLLEFHCLVRFNAFQPHIGANGRGYTMPIFMMVFFFMAVIMIPTFFAFSYLLHKKMFDLIRFGGAKRNA